MDLLTRQDVVDLTSDFAPPCVSIYVPTHRTREDVFQDPIRFKNLLRQAKAQLKDAGLRAPEAERILSPAADLLNETVFWEHMSEGLAAFLAPEFARFHRLPVRFGEDIVVGDHFVIRPLLPVFQDTGQYYILAISLKRVRLLECDRYSHREIELPGAPKSLADDMKYDELEKQLQYRTGASSTVSGRRGAVIYHGQGGGADETRHKGDILRFFHDVEKDVALALKNPGAPLIFAGVDYLFPIYQEANTHRTLIAECLPGNTDEKTDAQLHDETWALARSHFQREEGRAFAQYQQFKGTGRCSGDVVEIVPASFEGKIESLFLGTGEKQFGVFDPATFQARLSETGPRRDLVDISATQTLLHGGKVFCCDAERAVETGPCAAVFRY